MTQEKSRGLYTSVEGGRPVGSDEFKKLLTSFILDTSTSMREFADIPRGEVNHFIRNLKNSGFSKYFSVGVIGFDGEMRALMPTSDVKSCPLLASYDFRRGSHLYDTVLHTIEDLLPRVDAEGERGCELLIDLLVITDGEDSGSAHKVRESLNIASARAKNAGFQLVLGGIGVNAAEIAEEMGFPPSKAYSINRSGSGVHKVMRSVTERSRSTVDPIQPPNRPDLTRRKP